MQNADTSLVNKEGINPLIASCSEGHVEIVKMLLDHGKEELNSKDSDGTTALMAGQCSRSQRNSPYVDRS